MGTFDDLQPMTGGITPITVTERENRIEQARRYMTETGIDAIFLEGGSSLYYFTGLQWGRSERMTAAIIPAQGEISYICPKFEAERLHHSLVLPGKVRSWQEDESPFQLVASMLGDYGIGSGTIGMEQQIRFFLFDGIRQAAPGANFKSADPITVACRSIKSAAEIALMQRAMEITVVAYKKSISLLHEGISQAACRANAAAAHRALGVGGGIDFQFGCATALPHGSPTPQTLREGDLVLMDGGCTVEGYHSDISRPFFFGEPSPKQREIWDLEKEAQAAGFVAAQVGSPCEAVDAAARKVIVDAGLGPDYKTPGLPHRTGHGIGLDVHEAENMVRGNHTPLAPGMCFSIEPMIVIDGEFGLRLEDCVYMTDDGPRWFTQSSPAIDQMFVSS